MAFCYGMMITPESITQEHFDDKATVLSQATAFSLGNFSRGSQS